MKETSYGFVMFGFEIDGASEALFGVALFSFGQLKVSEQKISRRAWTFGFHNLLAKTPGLLVLPGVGQTKGALQVD